MKRKLFLNHTAVKPGEKLAAGDFGRMSDDCLLPVGKSLLGHVVTARQEFEFFRPIVLPDGTPLTSKMGATVQYCGHDGTFAADIIVVGGIALVVGNPNVNNILKRPAQHATHHLVDYPHCYYWNPLRGYFMVPADQCKVLKTSE